MPTGRRGVLLLAMLVAVVASQSAQGNPLSSLRRLMRVSKGARTVTKSGLSKGVRNATRLPSGVTARPITRAEYNLLRQAKRRGVGAAELYETPRYRQADIGFRRSDIVDFSDAQMSPWIIEEFSLEPRTFPMLRSEFSDVAPPHEFRSFSGSGSNGVSFLDQRGELRIARSVSPGEWYRATRDAFSVVETLNVDLSRGQLIHLTSMAGNSGIRNTGYVSGRYGIFAVPAETSREGTFLKMFRTGLPGDRTSHSIEIPNAAVGLFQRPKPIGMYSAWKRFSGVRFARAGSLNVATGKHTFQASSSVITPELLIYGPDLFVYTTVTGAVIFIEVTEDGK